MQTAALLDTNAILRYLLDDIPEQSAAVEKLLRADIDLILTDMVLAECEWVLRSHYKLDRKTICGLLGSALSLQGVTIPGEDVLNDAIIYYRWHKIDFTDAYLVASAAQFGTDTIATIDRDFDRLPGVVRIP